jgi:hypothetical protein
MPRTKIIKEDKEDEMAVYSTLCVSSLQTASSYLLEWCPNLITIYFLGRTGKDVLHYADR